MQVEQLTLERASSAGIPVPDVYFGPGYGAAEEGPGASWLLLEADGRWLLPLVLRDQGGIRDAVSPYGYAGTFAHPSLTRAEQAYAWKSARSVLGDLGVISVFLRRSPLVTQGHLDQDVKWVVRDHPTRAINVSPLDEVWAGMEGRCRTSIRKAERLGLTAEVRQAGDEDFVAGAPFRSLYEAAMMRRNADHKYLFPRTYYQALVEGLGSDLLIGLVRDSQGSPLAAALFLRHAPFLHYHLSGAVPDAGSLGATNLLIWEACKYAADTGLSLLHLGGGLTDRDSLYKFKRSFGGLDLSFSAAGVVIDQKSYDRQVEARAGQLNVSVEDLLSQPGFPAYRMGRGR